MFRRLLFPWVDRITGEHNFFRMAIESFFLDFPGVDGIAGKHDVLRNTIASLFHGFSL